MVTVFSPLNIALVKYWGKRDIALNLPVTDSLSLSARQAGTTTQIAYSEEHRHHITLNQNPIAEDSPFYCRLAEFLNRMAPYQYFDIQTKSDIPIEAGLASSASGFASMVLGLNELLQWNLSLKELSVLARMGSGSACRSLWPGLVHWKKGTRVDGRDSHGEPLAPWPVLRLGVLLLNSKPKPLSSRAAMIHCQETSSDYANWPHRVEIDIQEALSAIQSQDFEKLGTVTERSSEAMHHCMRNANPPVNYSLPETYTLIAEVKKLRTLGTLAYATQDAGPNVKLLYLEQDRDNIVHYFSERFQMQEL